MIFLKGDLVLSLSPRIHLPMMSSQSYSQYVVVSIRKCCHVFTQFPKVLIEPEPALNSLCSEHNRAYCTEMVGVEGQAPSVDDNVSVMMKQHQ